MKNRKPITENRHGEQIPDKKQSLGGWGGDDWCLATHFWSYYTRVCWGGVAPLKYQTKPSSATLMANKFPKQIVIGGLAGGGWSQATAPTGTLRTAAASAGGGGSPPPTTPITPPPCAPQVPGARDVVLGARGGVPPTQRWLVASTARCHCGARACEQPRRQCAADDYADKCQKCRDAERC